MLPSCGRITCMNFPAGRWLCEETLPGRGGCLGSRFQEEALGELGEMTQSLKEVCLNPKPQKPLGARHVLGTTSRDCAHRIQRESTTSLRSLPAPSWHPPRQICPFDPNPSCRAWDKDVRSQSKVGHIFGVERVPWALVMFSTYKIFSKNELCHRPAPRRHAGAVHGWPRRWMRAVGARQKPRTWFWPWPIPRLPPRFECCENMPDAMKGWAVGDLTC